MLGIDHDLPRALVAFDEVEMDKRRKGTKHARGDLVESLPAFSAFDNEKAVEPEEHDGKRKKLAWTHTEDLTILAIYHRIGTDYPHARIYELIASALRGRTADAVRNRCNRMIKNGHACSPKTEEGRQRLEAFIEQEGIVMPSVASVEVAAAGAASMCLHAASRRGWTAEEDATICAEVARQAAANEGGPHWRMIAKLLEGRSESSVRQRYVRALQPKAAAAGQSSPPPHTPLPPVAEGSPSGTGAALASLSPSSVAPEIGLELSPVRRCLFAPPPQRAAKLESLERLGMLKEPEGEPEPIFPTRGRSARSTKNSQRGRQPLDDDSGLVELSTHLTDVSVRELCDVLDSLVDEESGEIQHQDLPLGLANPEVLIDVEELKQALESVLDVRLDEEEEEGHDIEMAANSDAYFYEESRFPQHHLTPQSTRKLGGDHSAPLGVRAVSAILVVGAAAALGFVAVQVLRAKK